MKLPKFIYMSNDLALFPVANSVNRFYLLIPVRSGINLSIFIYFYVSICFVCISILLMCDTIWQGLCIRRTSYSPAMPRVAFYGFLLPLIILCSLQKTPMA